MHHHTEHSFVDEFRWVSTLHYLKNEWQNAVPLWCMLQAGPPFLNYCCAVMLHSCIILPSVSHSSNHKYHCCQLTGQLSGVPNFYRTFKIFIWLSLVVTYSTGPYSMSTNSIIIHYIRWGCQPPNPQEIHHFKWEFCVRFVQRFSGTYPWCKMRPACIFTVWLRGKKSIQN